MVELGGNRNCSISKLDYYSNYERRNRYRKKVIYEILRCQKGISDFMKKIRQIEKNNWIAIVKRIKSYFGDRRENVLT